MKYPITLASTVLMMACHGPAPKAPPKTTADSPVVVGLNQPNAPQAAPKPTEKKYPGYVETELPKVLADPLKDLTIQPLDDKPLVTQKTSLKNGMIVYTIEDHSLPLVDVAIMTDIGAVHATLGKEGLGDLTASVWRSGGTTKRSGDALDKELEDRAAEMGVNIGPEASSFRMDLMARDLEWGINLLAEVISSPSFPQEAIDLERARVLEEVLRQDDDPGSIVYNVFNERFFGTDNPWGRRATTDSLSALTRKDLVDFAAYYHPQRMRVIVTGDFSKEKLIPIIEKAFASWKPKPKALPRVLPPKLPTKTQVIYIEMGLPQTTFLLGVPGIGRKHPDQEVLSVFNDILGGSGFDSLLMEEIRSNRGLAYGVSSDLDVAGDFGGVLSIVGQTKAGSTVESIKLAIDILNKTRSGEMIRPEDLTRAKDSTLNSFVFRYASPFSLALQEATYELFGFPSDYISKLPEKIKAVTKEEIAKAATADIDTSKMILIVVGQKKNFDKPLTALGFGKPEEMPAPNLRFKI